MTTTQYLLVGLVMCLGSILQSASGFGYGLLAVPLLLLVDVPPYQAVPIVAMSIAAQALTGIRQQRRHVNWRQVVGLVSIAVCTQPLGVWLMRTLVDIGAQRIRQIIGLILIATVLTQWFWQPVKRDKLHPAWAVAAMSLSGILSGMAGIGGPPIVLWIMAHNWTNQRIRATLWCVFLCILPTNLFYMLLEFGRPVIEGVQIGLMFIPAALLGTLPGLWIGNRLPRAALERLAFVMLLLLGVYSVLAPMLR